MKISETKSLNVSDDRNFLYIYIVLDDMMLLYLEVLGVTNTHQLLDRVKESMGHKDLGCSFLNEAPLIKQTLTLQTLCPNSNPRVNIAAAFTLSCSLVQ